MGRGAPCLLLAGLLLATLVPSAPAGVVSREDRGSGLKIYYLSDPGEATDMIVENDFRRPGHLRIAGMFGTVSPRTGPGCTPAPKDQQSEAYASCPVDGTVGMEIVLGDGDDRAALFDDVTIPALLSGGDGNDALTGGGGADVLDGGNGNDGMSGGPAADRLLGREGDDRVDTQGDGAVDHIDCGLGEDAVLDIDFTDQINLCEPTLPNVLDLRIGFKKRGRGFTMIGPSFGAFSELSGLTLRVRCKGRGCPFRAKAYAWPPGRKVQRAFRRRVLARGTALDFRLVKRGWYGRGARLEAGKSFRMTQFCTSRDGRTVRPGTACRI